MAAFVDTNVLLYGVSTVRDEADKHVTALSILDRDDVVLSAQVLQEFYVQATRSTRADRLAHDSAVSSHRVLAALSCDRDDGVACAAGARHRRTVAYFVLGCRDRRSRPHRELSDRAF